MRVVVTLLSFLIGGFSLLGLGSIAAFVPYLLLLRSRRARRARSILA